MTEWKPTGRLRWKKREVQLGEFIDPLRPVLTLQQEWEREDGIHPQWRTLPMVDHNGETIKEAEAVD